MVRAAGGFLSTRRSSRERPEPKAPGSTSKPRWQPNLRQEARLSQCGRTRSCQLQLSLGAPRFAVVCCSQNWAMSGSLAQLSVATAQGQTQLVLQLLKVGKFPLHVGELFFQSAADRCTRLQAVSSQIQETANLTEFESQTLYAADKSECLHVALGVLTESPLCSRWSWEQGIAFVEANRVNAEANLLRDDANLHYLGSFLDGTAFERLFKERGLPASMRSDNGVPFASPNSLFQLSKLSVWWLRLGITIERIQPGHPQQNGRHERMHLTLKTETTRPAGLNSLQQQTKFDDFLEEFNNQRPHQALDMKCPAEVYTPAGHFMSRAW